MNRLYGFKIRATELDGNGPDCPVLVRYVGHVITKAAFKIVPQGWMIKSGWRRRVWEEIVEAFGWWGYSHLSKP